MSVQDLKSEIAQLPPDDLAELARWVEECRAQAWDRQIAQDAKAGKFDEMIQRAQKHVDAGQYQQVPISEKNAAAFTQLQAWLDEDATDDPEVIRQSEKDLAEFERNMNANRTATGERLVFP